MSKVQESAWIRRFVESFPDAQHIEYDALSSSAILDAHEKTHGARILPHYRFDKADVIVCEGFVGNVMLKMAESIYDIFKTQKGFDDPFLDNFNFEKHGGTCHVSYAELAAEDAR